MSASRYDAFLSYNSADRTSVERIATDLRAAGLNVFLDRWYLIPGESWLETLQQTIGASGSAVVFVGPAGLGTWQQREMALALDRQAHLGSFRVIPAILPRAEPPAGFLALNTWVDFRRGDGEPLTHLIRAIRGDAGETVRPIIASPYRSLKSFVEADAPFFFGRDEFVERLENDVVRHPFVVVAGPSGSGKSSAVRAGLFPRLRRPAGDQVWEIVEMRPGDRTLESLAAAFYPLLNDETEYVARRLAINQLSSEMMKGTIPLASMVRDLLDRQPGTDRLLLFVDQWEELYTLVRSEERTAFIRAVLEAVEQSPLTVVATLLGDFYGQAMTHRQFADRTRFVPISAMNASELLEVIQKPAAAVGAQMESGLAERLMEDLEQTPDPLPLLEFVLAQLWDGRRGHTLKHETYDGIGKLSGAIASHAEKEFRSLSADEQAIARKILLRLVVLGPDDKHTRRPGSFKELPRDSEPVVRKLAASRLLVTDADPATGQDRVEIVHEALLRRWKTLAGWIEEDRQFLKWREGLRVDVQRWIDVGRDAGMRLRGAPLQTAMQWRKRRGEELSADEMTFVGLTPRRRRKIVKWTAAIGLIVLMTGFAVSDKLANDAARQREMEHYAIKPQLQLPESDAVVSLDSSVLFTWSPVYMADAYDVEISQSSAFEQNLMASHVTEPAATMRLAEPGIYYWRVRSIDEFSASQYSAVRKVTADADERVVDFAPIRTGPKHRIPAAPMLHEYGIEIRNLSPAGSRVVIVNNKGLSEGLALIPTVSQNFLTQEQTGNGVATFELAFANPVDHFTFLRPKLYAASKSGVTFPLWTVRAYDLAGHEVASVSTALAATFKDDKQVATYTLGASGAQIATVRFESDPRRNGRPFAAFSAIVIEQIRFARSAP